MGQINRIPIGYLDMLGSQTGGKNPFDAADVVNPVIAMQPFYHAQGMSIESAPAFVVNALLDFAQLEVPQNEVWFVYNVSCQAAFTTAAGAVELVYSLFSTPAGVPNNSMVIGDTGLLNATLAVAVIGNAIQFPTPLPLVAGSRLRATVGDFTGTAVTTITFAALVAKFSA